MSGEENTNILATVDAVLAGRVLVEQPRAVLLFRLCQFAMLVDPEKAEKYWSQLQPFINKIPNELQGELTTLRTSLEEALPTGAKGFTAEMLAAIKAAKELEDVEETKQKLIEYETQLKKRFNPFGKGPVWNALVDAWIPIDRKIALQLLKNVSGGLQDNFIQKMNKNLRLDSEEWEILEESIYPGKVDQMALTILGDEKQDLCLSKTVLQRVAKQIRSAMEQVPTAGNENEVIKKFTLYKRLLLLHTNSDQAGLIPGLLEEFHEFVAKTSSLERIWPTRFILIKGVLNIGIQLGVQNLKVLTPEYIQRLVGKTPTYLVNYLWAAWAGLTIPADQTKAGYNDLVGRTKQDPNAEAWYLITLVERGLEKEALDLAAQSPRSQSLIPRVRHAWLCCNPSTAMQTLRPEDLAGDPFGELLMQGNAEKWAAYLETVTRNGSYPIPGALWAGVGTETQPDGLRGFWKQLSTSKKTLDEMIIEYLKRNPVYSSYQITTKKEDQFSETLRINGYGEYRYKDIDNILLAALVHWGDQDPAPVASVLRGMWNAIRPDDTLLRVDWLRNAIMSRCVSVFSADKAVLIDDYLGWVNTELVQKGRQWQIGNQVMTLRFPPTALFSFCVQGAAGVGAYSPTRRDQILVAGLERFETSKDMVEIAAQLYNSDKTPLSLTPPCNLKGEQTAGWQLGIIKNALPAILQTFVEQAQAKAQESAPA